MNTTRLVFWDKFLGRLCALLLNGLVRLVGKILRIDHKLERDYKRIMICKFKGMGSIIQVTPLLKTLRRQYPDARIIFVTLQGNQAIVQQCRLVDEIYTVNDRHFFALFSSSLSLIFRFWKKRPDLYLDLEIYSNFSSIIATLSLATNRFGFYLRSSNYRMGLYTHMMYFNTKAPIFEVYLQLARALSIEVRERELVRFEVADKTASFLPPMPYIVVNVNASDLRLERAWPQQSFVELIRLLEINYPGYKLVLIGSGQEKKYVEAIRSACPNPDQLISLAGKTSIPELISLIHHAALLITNDTGPMHIGFATRTKTIALFGPCSPGQYGYHASCFPIYKNVYCSPCVHEFELPPCGGNNECMQLIQVAEVISLVELVLHHPDAARNLYPEIIYQSDNLPLPDFPVLGFVCR